jgi:glycosyltransferase involved in cell wall biosynthesis
MTGGAERTFLSICRMFPEAPVYTAIYRPDTAMREFGGRPIRTLWPNRLPLNRDTYRVAFPAYALAFERLRLDRFDLVISSSSAFAKAAGSGARVRVAYCHTPPRFVWPIGESSAVGGVAERSASTALRPWLRWLDARAAARVTSFVANSARTAQRVRRFYHRDAEVIHPPVDDRWFRRSAPSGEPGFYLAVGRLVPYKGFEETVRACTALGRRLVVVGSGREGERLHVSAGPTIEFLGNVPEAELANLYASARALIVAGEDDWGMTPLEANASGCPVIAAARGGSLESVVDGVTGILYDPTMEALSSAIQRFEGHIFNEEDLVGHARQFDERAFQGQLSAALDRASAGAQSA